MVKLTPSWFPRHRWPWAIGILSLSFVFGGALAVSFAGLVAKLSGDNWRYILGTPAIVLLVLIGLTWWVLPRGPERAKRSPGATETAGGFSWRQIPQLFAVRQLHVICALSFALTFLRETFNFWTVDYLKTLDMGQGESLSTAAAALLSTPFDVMGGLGILCLGWVYGRLSEPARRWLLFAILASLSLLLLGLPVAARVGVWAVSVTIGLVGFLVYGPYSLLAGVLAVEVRGRGFAATVAGLVDGTGYFAAVLSGSFFGWLLTQGGYPLGFQVMAAITLVSAVLCLFLYGRARGGHPTPDKEH